MDGICTFISFLFLWEETIPFMNTIPTEGIKHLSSNSVFVVVRNVNGTNSGTAKTKNPHELNNVVIEHTFPQVRR